MRFPVIRQLDSTDCGPAALAMIAAYHGKRISIGRFRRLAGTDEDGTTLAGLINAAERVGFACRGVETSTPGLPQSRLPAIAHWRENGRSHFVVLYRITAGHAYIADPARGRRKLPLAEFCRHWSGIVVLLGATPQLQTTAHTQPAWTRLCSLLLPHRRLFLDALLAAVLIAILGLASCFLIQALVDAVLVFGQKPALNWLGLGMLLVLLARTAFLGLRAYLLIHLNRRIDADAVLVYHRHLLGLPLIFFATRKTGEILARLKDAAEIRIAPGGAALSAVIDTAVALVTATVMLALNWRVSLPAIAVIPATAAIVCRLHKTMQIHQRTAIDKAARTDARIMESVTAVQTVKALRAENTMILRTRSAFEEMHVQCYRAQIFGGAAETLTAFAAGLASLLVFWLGGREIVNGSMTVGRLMALNAMVGLLIGPFERLSHSHPAIQQTAAAAERLGEVLELNTERKTEREGAVDRRIAGSLEFRNVSFRYGARPAVMQNRSFQLEAGECVGVVGDSGRGKTTLAHLIAQLLEPTQGSILIDGIVTHGYSLDCLRREIGLIPQQIVLFNTTLAENIRLAHPAATAREFRAAATAARVDDIALRLPAGYETTIGEAGTPLSAGERLRIAVARVILRNPSILIVDEPACPLDRPSQAVIQHMVHERRGLHTTIVISQPWITFDWILDLNRSG